MQCALECTMVIPVIGPRKYIYSLSISEQDSNASFESLANPLLLIIGWIGEWIGKCLDTYNTQSTSLSSYMIEYDAAV